MGTVAAHTHSTKVDTGVQHSAQSSIEGSCHCGNLSYQFNTGFPTDKLTIRSCQCSFCRAHGAATARDPNGTVQIMARDPGQITLYRFGTKTTDFVLCANCGVYVGAVITQDGKQYATLNMRLSSMDVSNAEPIVYDDESKDVRVARRVQLFTPVVECPF